MDNQKLTKNERRELRRAEERKRDTGQTRKRQVKRILLWTGGLAVVVGAIYGLVRLANVSEGERPGKDFSIQGQEHIQIGTSHPAYNSNPPTSGWHYPQPANWGVYQEELPDEQVVHNLEHGGIWISYKDIDEATKAQLETIGKQYPGSVIVTPRAKNDSKIALASWGRLQKLDQFDEKLVLDFIKANKNKSPEPLAR